ncbi:MAG TPA: LuxR C-terminal-related transcriptional regulator, partial [Burkholderiaceae bacterium]|nr:LuxR C-terminal-related transcriptional regulator [Burkholderiaceae bacterium]
LLVFRDWGQALVALADRRANEARIALTRCFELATAQRNDLRAIQIGTSLVLAHTADDDRNAAFETLCEVLRAAQHSGANRSVLDAGSDLQAILPRFLVSSHCNAELAISVRRLLVVDVNVADKPNKAVAGTLTERERAVLMLVASGQSNKEVARSMNISAETVKTHLKGIFGKLGVQRREQAVVLARAVGLIAE